MKKVLYILFHRSVLVALSLLAQVVTLVVMVNIFSEYINSFYWCCIAISVIAALLILGSRIEPAYKIAWLLLSLPFPGFGGTFYLLVGGGHIPNRTSSRRRTCGRTSRPTTCSPWGRMPPGRPAIWSALPTVPPIPTQRQNTSPWAIWFFPGCWRS